MLHEKIMLSKTNDNVYLETYVNDLSQKYNRKAMLVIPGGGYHAVCHEHEGEPIAMAFIPYGFNAFVLHYTVDRSAAFPIQLIEVARAIKHIKDNADRYQIDPDELYIVGFSAGGHLAASAGVLWKMDEVYEAVPMPYGYNRPKGVILSYPVVSPKYKQHFNSFKNMWCNDNPDPEDLKKSAIEEHVDADSAPAFIWHTADDKTVDVRNAFDLARAYADAGVPFEFHVFPNGPHGMSLANHVVDKYSPEVYDEHVASWVRLASEWIVHNSKK